MLVSNLHSSKYLVTKSHFEAAELEWTVFNEVPLTFSVSVAGGLITATKEREMWHKDRAGNDKTLWMFRFYAPGDKEPFFWFSNSRDNIGDLEIEYINQKLIERIGEIEWKEVDGAH